MNFQNSQEHYRQLANLLKEMIRHFDPTFSPKAFQEGVQQIILLAQQIGAPLQEEAQKVQEAFDQWFQAPQEKHLATSFLGRVIRLEQETREM